MANDERLEVVGQLMELYHGMGDALELVPDVARFPVLAALVAAVIRTQFPVAEQDAAVLRFMALLSSAVSFGEEPTH